MRAKAVSNMAFAERRLHWPAVNSPATLRRGLNMSEAPFIVGWFYGKSRGATTGKPTARGGGAGYSPRRASVGATDWEACASAP